MNDYYNLGTHGRAVSTSSPEAQIWFDRGLVWTYAFNHEEAIKCFEKALEIDPDCAMARWGIAYAIGPNYNKAWDAFDENDLTSSLARAYDETHQALAQADRTTPAEQALISALQHRYQSREPVEMDEFTRWSDEYADAMRGVYQQFADDLDIATLFAEALMNRTPWQLWDLNAATPAEGASTTEARDVLERALDTVESRTHPGVLHMYIHLMEMSPFPEKALRASDWLRDLVPDGGHLQHMPTHIDVLCGQYHNVVAWNHEAIIADRKYLEREGPMNFYTLYRAHNYHFKLYGALFMGQYETAADAADELVASIPDELLRMTEPNMADWVEGIMPMKMHVYIRFGKWQEIIDTPLPEDQELYSVTTAVIHYAKGVAFSATGQIAEAEREKELFEAAYSRVPDTRYLFNNSCLDILAVARQMLYGELEYRKGNFDLAFDHLRQSIELDDNLPYDEPWGWMQPTRHAYGALLLEQGHVEEAATVYRADLGLDGTLARTFQHPENVWSLHGYHECLQRMGKDAEAHMIKQRLDLALARSDTPIHASCFCRMSHAA
jgi:tetratricopeptide (TPR) repeat protein